jgi:hypothetical protein
MSDHSDARARAAEALSAFEERLADDEREGRQPQASPTTHADCADLYGRAADAIAQAMSDYDAGAIDAARAGMALGKELMAAGDSCVASASGEIIEV